MPSPDTDSRRFYLNIEPRGRQGDLGYKSNGMNESFGTVPAVPKPRQTTSNPTDHERLAAQLLPEIAEFGRWDLAASDTYGRPLVDDDSAGVAALRSLDGYVRDMLRYTSGVVDLKELRLAQTRFNSQVDVLKRSCHVNPDLHHSELVEFCHGFFALAVETSVAFARVWRDSLPRVSC